MRKTLRRAVVLGLLAFAAPFAALPLAKPAAAMPEASAPVLPDAVDIPAATPQPVLPAVPESRSFDADAPILLNDGGEEITVSVQEFLIGTAASELPPDWPDDAVLAQMVATHSYARAWAARRSPATAPSARAGRASRCCARGGAAILPHITAGWPHWQTRSPGPCCAGTVRLPRPVTTAAAPGRPRQARTCG